MTQELEDGHHLVRVRAQVMMREDSTGGWVPLGGGGLSHVAVRKRKIHHEDDPPCKHEYLIYGKRINDQKVVMSCTIKRDFVYNRVMPTFHHWKTGNLKYGLTFQTAADARAFDKGVNIALEDLLSEHTVACPHKHCRLPPNTHGLSSPVSPVGQLNRDVEEDDRDVFMTLELPLERDSGSSGESSPVGETSPPPATSSPNRDTLQDLYPQFETHHRMNFPNLHRSRTITGVPTRLRASRAPGLPPSDTGPLGDNIYEWLQTCPKTERIPLRTRISEEQVDNLDSLDKFKDRGKPDIRTFEKDFVNFRYNIPMAPGPGPGGPGGYDPRYVALPGEDSVFDELYGTDAYVKLDILPVENQYHYPNLDTASKGLIHKSPPPENLKRDDGPCSRVRGPSPPSNKRKKDKDRGKKFSKKVPKKPPARLLQERCVHCHELYAEVSHRHRWYIIYSILFINQQADNAPGSCRYSPDVLRQGIECMSCLACAKCLLYHCHYEEETFTDDDICTCDDTDGHLGKRWLGLSLLAVLVPCLCLYPLLTACHNCGRACRLCGGRHVAG